MSRLSNSAVHGKLVSLLMGFLALTSSWSVCAHTMNFSTLYVQQESANGWQIQFQQSSKKASNESLVLPEGCLIQFQNQSKPKPNQVVKRWWVDCAAGSGLDWITLKNRSKLQVYFQVESLNGDVRQKLMSAQTNHFNIVDRNSMTADNASTYRDAQQYIGLGLSHILEGYDHLAFVLLVILMVSGIRTVVTVVTAFTVGHSVTLILASFNLIHLNQTYVEWMIALSILFLAREIIVGKSSVSVRYPAIIALLFGLVHGLGFAFVLRDIGLPEQNQIMSLLLFNLGVEAGQLLFIGFVLPVIYWLNKQCSTMPKKTIAFMVGSLASYWLIVRTSL